MTTATLMVSSQNSCGKDPLSSASSILSLFIKTLRADVNCNRDDDDHRRRIKESHMNRRRTECIKLEPYALVQMSYTESWVCIARELIVHSRSCNESILITNMSGC